MSSTRKRSSDTMIVSKNQQQDQQEQQQFPNSTNQRQLRVRIKRFHGVAKWTWNANDEVCGICQAAFEGTAPGVKYPGEDCPVVWGKCGHAFHLQCVSKWLSQQTSKNSCPYCRQEWEFGQNPVNNQGISSES